MHTFATPGPITATVQVAGGFHIERADGGLTAKTGDGAITIGRLTR